VTPDSARPVPKPSSESLEPQLVLAFAPLHKRAFGIAIGSAVGLLVAAATVIVLLRGPEGEEIRLGLLSQYFYGYSVSWPGVLVGFGWAFVAGFTAGWFLAFVRNLIVGVSVFLVRTRAELHETRDFLDHI